MIFDVYQGFKSHFFVQPPSLGIPGHPWASQAAAAAAREVAAVADPAAAGEPKTRFKTPRGTWGDG